MIATPDGQRLAEDLRAGDRVLCEDAGVQEILWVGARDLSLQRDDLRQHPIEFRADMLGMPDADLVVSPQHCVLLDGPIVAKQFGTDRVLVPGRGLLGLPGVRLMRGKNQSLTFRSSCENMGSFGPMAWPAKASIPVRRRCVHLNQRSVVRFSPRSPVWMLRGSMPTDRGQHHTRGCNRHAVWRSA